MKVGDLVRWNQKTYPGPREVGIIIKVAAPHNLVAMGMVHIQWADGRETKNWHKEVEIINEK